MPEQAPAADRVCLSITEGIATITLVREARMNAFDEKMHADLRTALADAVDEAGVRVIVLTGNGRAFSAGQDLGERAATFNSGAVPDLWASLDKNYNPLIRSIADIPLPVIAAVNGIASGAGAALAIACDLVIAARSATLQFGFVNVGLGPDGGASWFLPRLIGQVRAMDLMLTGRAITAEAAMAMGLVGRIVDDVDLAESVAAMARELAEKSRPALAAIKRQMRTNSLGLLDAALDAERNTQSELAGTAEYRDAVLRFARPRSS